MLPEALVIEDDVAQRAIFTNALEKAGYRVTSFSEGKAALAYLIQQPPPHLIILDLHLPGVEGPEIARAIRANGRLDRTYLILATADDRLAETLYEITDWILLKPISYTQLRDLAMRLKDSVRR